MTANWLARWRARRRQHNAALDGDTTAYLNTALPELPLLICAACEAGDCEECGDFGSGERAAWCECENHHLDAAGRSTSDDVTGSADPSTTPKHRKAKPRA